MDDVWTQPTMDCPRCGVTYEDFDGIGVLHCKACGFCQHASRTGVDDVWTCDYCGDERHDR